MGQRIVELTGLPGSGKSTLAETVRSRAGRAAAASASRTLMRAHLHWLALPGVWLRFGSVLRTFRELTSTRETVTMLNKLCRVSTERALLAIESGLRRRLGLQDEGYVQVGLGLWLRAPGPARDQLFGRYMRCVPRSLVCLCVDLAADEALRRVRERSGGRPFDPAVASLLQGELGVRTLRVDARGVSPERVATRALEQIETLWPDGLVVLCRSDAAAD